MDEGSSPGKRVFVVEDLPLMRDLLIQILESLGHAVVGKAETGRQAVKDFAALKPELITLDVSLPDIDGLFVLKEMRMRDKQVKILLVTANDQPLLHKEGLRFGAAGVLLKPFTAADVEAALLKVWPR